MADGSKVKVDISDMLDKITAAWGTVRMQREVEAIKERVAALERGVCHVCGSKEHLSDSMDPFVLEGISATPEGTRVWCESCLEGRRLDV